MIRPDFVGRNIYYKDPNAVTAFTSAQLALIDTARTTHLPSPYAYTATVADDFDEHIFNIESQSIVSGMKVAYGLFLSADLLKQSLLFNLIGTVWCDLSDSNLYPYFFFGRTSASTVTSTLAGTANALDNCIILPHQHMQSTDTHFLSINEQLFGKYVSDGEIWCFGVAIENNSGADRSVLLKSNLAFHKFVDTSPVFSPDRT